jgi:NDP-sugar pyrophosphorylase family protein
MSLWLLANATLFATPGGLVIAPTALSECPVLILAGGLGTRLRPIVADRPKALAPIGDQPFLEIQLTLLRDQGARRFVLCVGHRADQIRALMGDGSRLGIQIDYSVESGPLLGTGGALRLAERFIQPRALVLNGDTYLAADYARLYTQHVEERAGAGVVATLTLARLDEAQRFGTVRLEPGGRYLAGFHEKPKDQDPDWTGAGWLNAGAYVIERDLVDLIPPGVPCSLERDVFPAALAAGRRFAAFPIAEPFFDIGTPDDFHAFLGLFRRNDDDDLPRLRLRAAGTGARPGETALVQSLPQARGGRH